MKKRRALIHVYQKLELLIYVTQEIVTELTHKPCICLWEVCVSDKPVDESHISLVTVRSKSV